jgi:hypothetical protein
MESTIAAATSTAATAHVSFFDSNRRTRGQRACLAMVTEADESGVASETGRAGRVSRGLVGWESFMT